MEEMLAVIISMFLVLALIPLYLWKRRQDSRSPKDRQDEPQVAQREAVVRPAGNSRMRRRPAAGASMSAAAAAPIEEAADGSDDEGVEDETYEAKASRKKEKKRQERESQRQAEQAARDSRQTKQDRYAEIRRKKDEEREAQERQLEEEAKAQKAREEEAAALEFEKWKGEFSIDAEGTTENEVQGGHQDLLSTFMEYIKECINRINSLECMGRLSGVMDDREIYIHIPRRDASRGRLY